MAMLQILMMTSGAEVLALTLDEYNDLATDGQTSVRHLKLRLEAVTGQPRFRQHLLCGERMITDDDVLELPIVLHLVLLSLFAPPVQILDKMNLALQMDDVNVVDDFLHQPHDPNQADVGGSFLCMAARYGSLRSAKLLLEAKASLDEADSQFAWTPLQWASASGHAEFTRWLLQSKADIRKAEENGRPLLHSTCFHGEVEVVRMFLEAGVDPNTEDVGGRTPLIVATVCEHLELVQLLLDSGVDINHISSGGMTPLHMACAGGHAAVARIFLEAGADPNMKDGEGRTPLIVSTILGRIEMASLLLQRQADPSHRFRAYTPLEIATAAGQPEMVCLISEAMEARELSRQPKRRRRMKGPP